MDFFNSLSQIAKNKDNFKKWEKEQLDEQSQREELYRRRQYSDEEIARAKALGENIIDVIDIMDNHSESVAENVETATEPMVALAPFAALGLSYWAAFKMIFKPNNLKRTKIFDEILDGADAKALSKNIYEDRHERNGSDYGFGPHQLKDKKQIDKIENPELREQALKIYQKYQKEMKPLVRSRNLGLFAMAAATIASFIGINIYAAKLQVDSSKIARFQARESLKDPKAFVTYTPEQIAKAKEEIAKHPEWVKEKKKEKLKTGLFKSIINLFKDRKAYKKSVENDTDESKLVTRELTPEEIEQAKRDKEIIQRSVRLINNEAEKYSQNMEVASEVLINGTPFLGAAVGGAIGWILNKLRVIEKIIDKSVEKNGSAETKKLYADLKKGKESGKSVLVKWSKFSESFLDDLHLSENNVNTEGMTKEERKLATKKAKARPKDVSKCAKRIVTVAFAHPVGKNWILGGIGAIVTGVAGALIGLKLQKSASRAGRYTAKRELEKDPRNFIGYTEDDYNEVKDVKNQKSKGSKVKEVITFLPTVIKQYFAYEKFRKKEYKENKLLQERLMKQEVTEEQIRDAKNLQRKLFNTFEKVDDNSQTYSESMEAAIDIAQPFVMYGSFLAILSPLFIGSYMMYKGKLSPAKVINKFLGFMGKSTESLQSKWFKKYLENVSKNVSTKVQNTQVSSKPLAPITTGIDIKKDSITQILSKLWSNVKVQFKDLSKMSDDELYEVKNRLRKVIAAKNPELAAKFSDIFHNLILYHDKQVRADVLTILMQPSAIREMPRDSYMNAYQILEDISKSIISNKKIWALGEAEQRQFKNLLRQVVDTIDTDKLRQLLRQLKEMPELREQINDKEIESILKAIEDFKPVKIDADIISLLAVRLEALSQANTRLFGFINTKALAEVAEAGEKADRFQIRRCLNALESLKQERNIEHLIGHQELDDLIKSLEKFKEQNFYSSYNQPEIFAYDNVVKILDQVELWKKQLKEVSKLPQNEKIRELLESCFGDKLIPISVLDSGIRNKLIERNLITENQHALSLTQANDLFKELKLRATRVKIEDLIKNKSPKDVLSKIKTNINEMSDEEFLNRMEDMNIAALKMDKKTMLEIVQKVEKIIDNVPKEEMQQIMDTILKEMTEHPDEFIKFLSEGKPTSIFVTPGLKRALSIAGISWATFMLVLTYAIESWLADIKLKSGRLGVMKAMEGLNDPRYYANIEQVQPQVSTKNNNTVQTTTENKVITESTTSAGGNLLDKYKK